MLNYDYRLEFSGFEAHCVRNSSEMLHMIGHLLKTESIRLRISLGPTALAWPTTLALTYGWLSKV